LLPLLSHKVTCHFLLTSHSAACSTF
jgi:hypothetical protein